VFEKEEKLEIPILYRSFILNWANGIFAKASHQEIVMHDYVCRYRI